MRINFILLLTHISYMQCSIKKDYVGVKVHKSTLRKKTQTTVHLDNYVHRDLCLNLIKPFQTEKNGGS